MSDLLAWLVAATIAGVAWTLWSANLGRRAARWGRRKVRLTVLLLLAVGVALAWAA
jgi:MFS-type transporter involved in bile tolerance (Atg22 family)